MSLPITKVGVVPFYDDAGGVRHFLLHKPKPKRDAGADIPYGLCRGTRRYLEDGQLIDARTPENLTSVQVENLEDYADTALCEAGEELGLTIKKEMLISLGDSIYESPNKTPYSIHWFATKMDGLHGLRLAEDAAGTLWVTIEEAQAMAQKGRFKSGYLEILNQVLRIE